MHDLDYYGDYFDPYDDFREEKIVISRNYLRHLENKSDIADEVLYGYGRGFRYGSGGDLLSDIYNSGPEDIY